MTYAMSRAISAYRQAATAVSPIVAVVMLYDEALNSIRQAVHFIELKEYEMCFQRIQKCTDILRGLRQNLDLEQGGALGQQLCDTYTRNIFALTSSIGKKDAAARLQTLSEGLLELRNAFASIAGMNPRGS